MPNDIEVMAAARTTSDRTRRVMMAGFRNVARGRIFIPLGTCIHGCGKLQAKPQAMSVLGCIDTGCDSGV
jgi:hypothetical protein